jgi:hypothetical protein
MIVNYPVVASTCPNKINFVNSVELYPSYARKWALCRGTWEREYYDADSQRRINALEVSLGAPLR